MSAPTTNALLPAGLMDLLPPAAAFEADVVARLVGVFAGFGYERVKPPLIEFEDTLLAGAGEALAPQTFRLMDPSSQRMLGLRADMTMQVARIAQSRLGHVARPLRLGYAGQVVRVKGSQLRPERQFGQVGAELVGAPMPAADVEVITAAAEALRAAGIGDLSVDLGLPSLVPSIVGARPMEAGVRERLLDAVARKDVSAVDGFAGDVGRETVTTLVRLIEAVGPAEPALAALAALPLPAEAALHREDLFAVCRGLEAEAADLRLSIDAVEQRGLSYHTGITFSFFSRAVSGELGRGGRYRTAGGEAGTGVSLFLDAVLRALPPPVRGRRLYLPKGTAPATGGALRAAGWVTVAGLDESSDPRAEAARLACSHWLAGDDIRAVDAPAAPHDTDPKG
jgi:ATP phosphoribosyltransferase regulatory subunit